MGEILVAQGKRRRSDALGMKWRMKSVRTKTVLKANALFRTELKSREKRSYIRESLNAIPYNLINLLYFNHYVFNLILNSGW